MKMNNTILLIIIGLCTFLFICDNPSDTNEGPVPNTPHIAESVASATKIRFRYGSVYNGHPIDSFIIYWSLTPDQGTSGNAINGLYENNEYYTHSGLTPKTNYYYAFVAYNKNGKSLPSIDTCITTDSLHIPGYLDAQSYEENSVFVEWYAEDYSLLLDTLTYKVYWSTQSGQGINAEFSLTSTDEMVNLTGVQTFTNFYFVVTSILGTYESSPSPEGSFKSGGKITDAPITDDSLKLALSSLFMTYVDDVDSLYLRGKGIKSISGLEWFSNLKILYIDTNEVSDIAPLQYCKNFQKLHAKKNQISVIEGLLSLKELSYVDLAMNSIEIPCDDLQQLIDSLDLGNIIPPMAVDEVTCTDQYFQSD